MVRFKLTRFSGILRNIWYARLTLAFRWQQRLHSWEPVQLSLYVWHCELLAVHGASFLVFPSCLASVMVTSSTLQQEAPLEATCLLHTY